MINKIKSDILASVKNKKINIFFLFLLSSFVILIFIKLSKEYTNTLVFEIEKVNVPDENVILNDSLNLNITLKAQGFKWLKYYLSKPKIEIDFSKDVSKKKNFFVWNKSKDYLESTQFDKEIALLNIAPNKLIFRYDVNLVKRVPVKLKTEFNFSQGYDVSESIILEPDSITVIGPNILVSKINYLETEEIIYNKINADLHENINLSLPEKKLNLKFSAKNITLKAKVEKFTEGVLKIPVRVINVPEGTRLKYFPKTVNVSYYVSLNNFKLIQANDFQVVCDYKKSIENKSLLIPELIVVPGKVKNVKMNQQRIEFIITK